MTPNQPFQQLQQLSKPFVDSNYAMFSSAIPETKLDSVQGPHMNHSNFFNVPAFGSQGPQ
jgi:hypothetical protein